ncbi:MAG: Chemoreceptor glutamine deamidase CheD [Deltaproteobacteria bacterium ADurb.Bin510]|nr:MAG: Chemoreceptor glutamine deamidase CheD [Deltaproteobacteria bacterium ADurb.Bin510]
MTAARFLKPGEIVLTERPGTITTVLGSCVSVIVRDPLTSLSAMCHAMLPDSQAEPRNRHYPASYYVDAAVRRMLAEFDSRGLHSRRLEVAVIGGAALAGGRFAVGQGNVMSALKTLAELGLRPATLDVGGSNGRRLSFDTATGELTSTSLGRVRPARTKACSRS